MATTWLVRTTGSNSNGGTSASVRSTGTDGICVSGHTTLFSSISAAWTSADVGHGIYASSGTILRLISAVQTQISLGSITTSNGSAAVTSSALFTSAMLYCAISGPGIPANAYVSAYTDTSHITISANAGAGYGSGAGVIGAKLTTTGTTGFTAATGQTWNVGGALLTVNRALVTASGAINAMAAGDLVFLGAGVYRETTAVGISGAATASGTNGVTSNGGTTFTDSTAAAFTSGMVGNYIEITAGGSTFGCKISAYTSASVVTIAPATATGFPTAAFSSCTWNVGKIAVIGDVDGAQTGDAGQVTISAYTTNDKSAPSATILLSFTTHGYLSHSLLTFIGGGARIVENTTTGTSPGTNHTFLDCVFNNFHTAGQPVIDLYGSTAGTPLATTLDRCIAINAHGIALEFGLYCTASGAADFDNACIVRNCLLVTFGLTAATVNIPSENTNTYHPGGVRIYGCTILGYLGVSTGANISTSVACEIHNSFIIGSTGISASSSGQITGSYNSIYANTPATNYTYGTGDVSNSAGTGTYLAPLLELGQSQKWAGVIRQFMAPDGASSPLLGTGSATFTGNYPNFDWAGRPRPSGGQSANAAIGYSELHDYAIEDTVVYNDSPASGELVGPGDQFILVPVDGVSSTISIYVRFDSYGGTNYPTVNLLANGELGVAAQTQQCSSSSGTFQQLTFSAITPSKAGWVTIQVVSYDTGGTGTVHFDTLAVA